MLDYKSQQSLAEYSEGHQQIGEYVNTVVCEEAELSFPKFRTMLPDLLLSRTVHLSSSRSLDLGRIVHDLRKSTPDYIF